MVATDTASHDAAHLTAAGAFIAAFCCCLHAEQLCSPPSTPCAEAVAGATAGAGAEARVGAWAWALDGVGTTLSGTGLELGWGLEG